MEFLADLASGSGPIGALVGTIGGIASAFVKYKTLKESNRHSFAMAELAGSQEVARAEAALHMKKVEGAIKTDLAIEASLQESFKHDAAIGSWLQGREMGPITTGLLAAGEFVRMMMRPVLTLWVTIKLLYMYDEQVQIMKASAIDAVAMVGLVELIAQTIVLLATTAFTWWFADRSVAKALTKKLSS